MIRRSMAPSGVQWLGEIPYDWQVLRFRHVFTESPEKIELEVIGPMLSVSGYRGIEIKEYDDENRRRLDEELIGYRVVRPGQLVVNTMWLNYAGLGISDHEGHVSPAYRSYNFKTEVCKRYIHYLMRSSIYVQGYTQLLTGIRPNSLQMSRDDLMNFPILLPPLPEQTAITAFLDRETGKIDGLVEEQKRLIELLKEKRQAVISHAVAKGLDPNARMRSSGVEWLGDVPEHWRVLPLRRVISSIDQGWSPQAHDREPADDEPSVLRLSAIKDGVFQPEQRKALPDLTEEELRKAPLVEDGDLLITRANTPALVGDCAIATAVPGTIFSDLIYRLNLRGDDAYAPFVLYMLRSDALRSQVRRDARGSSMTMAKIAHGHIKSWIAAFPPMQEQVSIAAHLEKELGALNKIQRETEHFISLLQERRAILISAAVTGKLDVRHITSQEKAA